MSFFNKIRKDQIPAQGMKRYFFYEIGEILLVIVGILLALEVDHYRTALLTLPHQNEMTFNEERDSKSTLVVYAKHR